MRRLACVLLAAALSACNFQSGTSLFEPEEGVFPIADGTRFQMRDYPPGEAEWHEYEEWVLLRDGPQYRRPGESERSYVEVVFVALPETPEEDYIVQMRAARTAEDSYYAFIWRSGDLFKIIGAPETLDDMPTVAKAMERFCTRGLGRSCEFGSRDALLDFYREAVYPTFVAPDAASPGRVGYAVPMNQSD